MRSVRLPGESAEYRAARDALLEAELELRRQIESVAAQRRALPVGGEVPTDYDFLWPLWAILDRTPQGAAQAGCLGSTTTEARSLQWG